MDEPTTLRAGDSAGWLISLPATPPGDGWSLKYRLLWPTGGAPVDITATPEGDNYRITLSAATTAVWPAGNITAAKYIERGVERLTLGSLPLTIQPDLTSAVTFDARTANQKALADANAALAAYLASGQLVTEEYEIAGRRMKFRDTKAITDLIAYYERRVAQERAALAILSGGSLPGRVYYRG